MHLAKTSFVKYTPSPRWMTHWLNLQELMQLFRKLDANCGFRQIPLAKKSRHLTTFVTPYGRYCFNKLPFGISSAPEHFLKANVIKDSHWSRWSFVSN